MRASLFCICLFTLSIFSSVSCTAKAGTRSNLYKETLCSGFLITESGIKPGPLTLYHHRILKDHKRFIAACLAFPLPTGFLGAHRIFLGTNPYIPVAYVATLGGCLGVIPAVDFFAILFSRDLDQYTNNPRMFMWLK
jgi:hypothetical protein